MASEDLQTQRNPRNEIRALLEKPAVQEQMARVLPAHLTPERMARVAITAMTKNPRLFECTQETIMRCLMDCSAVGLEPNGREAHLIPHRNNKAGVVECTLIFDYKGLITLARRTGKVDIFRAETVCENDEFTWENGIVQHRIDFRQPRGKVFAVYSHVKFTSGVDDYAVMTRDEVESIRKRSRAGESGPWVSDWSEMAKKTAIRNHSKRLEISPELTDALEKDDDRLEERNVTPRTQSPARGIAHDPTKPLELDEGPGELAAEYPENYDMEPPK